MLFEKQFGFYFLCLWLRVPQPPVYCAFDPSRTSDTNLYPMAEALEATDNDTQNTPHNLINLKPFDSQGNINFTPKIK
jgi:hypothetical protein